ncbi:MAG: hypothetical protein AAFR81_11750 [Chloroflexota bacterium]
MTPTQKTKNANSANVLVDALLYEENTSFLLGKTNTLIHHDEVVEYIYSKNWSDKIVREHPIVSISFYAMLGLFSLVSSLLCLLLFFGIFASDNSNLTTLDLDVYIFFALSIPVAVFLIWVGYIFFRAVYLILRFKRQNVDTIYDAIIEDPVIVEGTVKRVKAIPSGRRIHYRYELPTGETKEDYFVTRCQCVALGYAEKDRKLVVVHHSNKYSVVL